MAKKKPKKGTKGPKPQPIPNDYNTFLNLAQGDEDFRQALYQVQGTQAGDLPYDTVYNKLVSRGVTTSNATYYLVQIVLIDWQPIYAMEQQLGRLPDSVGLHMG
jgi:hypothetical protein